MSLRLVASSFISKSKLNLLDLQSILSIKFGTEESANWLQQKYDGLEINGRKLEVKKDSKS
jgi:hypothetical protein